MAVTSVTPGITRLDTNGATAVTAVGSPAASTTRAVLSLRVFNADTAVADVTLQTNVGGTKKTIEKVTALAVGATWKPIDRNNMVFCDATNVSLEIFLGGAVTTTQLRIEAEWIDLA